MERMDIDDMDIDCSFSIPKFMKHWTNGQKADFAYQILSTLPASEVNSVVDRLASAASEAVSILSESPYEILLLILSFLDLHSLLQASLVSTEWYVLCKEQCLWKNLFEKSDWTYDQVEMYNYLQQQQQPSVAIEGNVQNTEMQESSYNNNNSSISSIPIKRLSSSMTMGQLSSRMKQFRISSPSPTLLSIKHRNRTTSSPTTNQFASRLYRTRLSSASPSSSPPLIQAATETVGNIRRVKTFQLIKKRREEDSHPIDNNSLTRDFRIIPNSVAGEVEYDTEDYKDTRIQKQQNQVNQHPPYIDWQQLYKNRYAIEQRWLTGSCKIEHFPGNDCPPSELHTEGIYCVQFDKEKMITGSRDHTIKIWNIATGRCQQTLRGHSGSVLCLQYDNQHIVSGSSDATVLVSRITTGRIERKLIGHEDSVLGLRLISDDRIISCSKDRTLRIWNRITGKCLRVLNDHRAAVNSVQFRGNIAVSASGDRTIKIWDLETGECLRTLSSHTRGVACVEYDGIHIVSGSSDQTIKVWNADTGECLYTLCGHTELVRTIQLDTTTNRIISGCYNGHIKLWDLKRGKLLRDLGQATDGR